MFGAAVQDEREPFDIPDVLPLLPVRGFFEQHELHLHVPAGAIPKDGRPQRGCDDGRGPRFFDHRTPVPAAHGDDR